MEHLGLNVPLDGPSHERGRVGKRGEEGGEGGKKGEGERGKSVIERVKGVDEREREWVREEGR